MLIRSEATESSSTQCALDYCNPLYYTSNNNPDLSRRSAFGSVPEEFFVLFKEQQKFLCFIVLNVSLSIDVKLLLIENDMDTCL